MFLFRISAFWILLATFLGRFLCCLVVVVVVDVVVVVVDVVVAFVVVVEVVVCAFDAMQLSWCY